MPTSPSHSVMSTTLNRLEDAPGGLQLGGSGGGGEEGGAAVPTEQLEFGPPQPAGSSRSNYCCSGVDDD